MKKFNYLLMGAAGLILASCSNEDLVSNVAGSDEATVTINLSTPQISTRVYSDGETAQKLQYAVYKVTTDASGNKTLVKTGYEDTNAEIHLKTQVNFKLVTGHTYGFVFWAAEKDAPYYLTLANDGATMDIDYGPTAGVCANNEKLDAFYAYEEVFIKGDETKEIVLTRPFAQINVGTSDLLDANKAGYTPVYSHISVDKVYKTLDLVSGEVSSLVDGGHDYYASPLPSGETFPKIGDGSVKYDYLSMAYVLVPAAQETIEVEFCVIDENLEHAAEHTVGSVPVKRNYRTNIYGQLITSSVDVNVIIEPNYTEPDYVINHDGVEYDSATSTFTITNAHGLQWLSRMVNGNAGTRDGNAIDTKVSTLKPEGAIYGSYNYAFTGQTVKLANDIDMEGVDFQPIGYFTKLNDNDKSLNAFAGTFDGNGKTISHLTINQDEKNYHAGFFGFIAMATVKDLTLTDIDIKGHYKVGGLAADVYMSDIENCKVIGGTITSTPWEKKPGVWDDGNNAGGLIGYLNVQPGKATITNNQVEGLEITAYRKIGGLIGAGSVRDDPNPNHTCGITIKGNTVKDVKLTADMTEIRYAEQKAAEVKELYGSLAVDSYADPNDVQTDGFTNVTIKEIIPAATPTDAASLKDALDNIKDGDVIVVNGEINEKLTSLPSGISYTIKGVSPEDSSLLFEYIPSAGSTVTVENITITSVYNQSNHTGSAITGVKEITFNNVHFDSEIMVNSGDATFNNCLFTYNPMTDPRKTGRHGALVNGGNATFNDCVFDCSAATDAPSLGIGTYGENIGNITLNNCEFIGGKVQETWGVFELNTAPTKSAGIININNSTYDETAYPKGWFVESNGSEETKLFTVIVDGETVQ